MGATAKVSAQEITNALLHWRGNVQAAADALGLTRNGLYGRIETLGINLKGYRAKVGTTVRTMTPMPTIPPTTNARGTARKNQGAHFQSKATVGRVGAMQEAATSDAPVRQAVARQKPLRLADSFRDRLREAKLDFVARFRVETDENVILEQFFEEAFEGWLRSKLSATKKAK
jgi:Bacterial regulatory protein, Fis family